MEDFELENYPKRKDPVEQFIEETNAQIRIAMLSSGVKNIAELQQTTMIKVS